MADFHEPKYLEVQSYLLDQIQRGLLLPGQKAPSENELAALFHISRLTARHALTLLVQNGLLQRQQGRGTFICDRCRRIGVCMTYVDSYIFPDILRGIDAALRQNQLALVLMSSNNETAQEQDALTHLLDQGLDGLIWEPARSALRPENDEILAKVRQSRLPTVLINSQLPFPEAGQVLTADASGMALLINYLAGLGHRRFAGLFCRDLIQGHRRKDGFLTALKRRGFDPRDAVLMDFDSRDLTAGFPELVRELAVKIQKSGSTALCCYNDQVAFHCYQELTHLGLSIPGDLSLTGFDAVELLSRGSDPAGLLKGLTTVTHPGARLGREAANMLVHLMQDVYDEKGPILEMPVEFISGTSTAPCGRSD
ncbi:MAG: GntR family transcriptional regulator [Clostridiaceae bacterium]|nr:GntR family transcriptional regulator [Clostridiaceae bacterium]